MLIDVNLKTNIIYIYIYYICDISGISGLDARYVIKLNLSNCAPRMFSILHAENARLAHIVKLSVKDMKLIVNNSFSAVHYDTA